jgi:GNAT superfamily N-acetyltransferase
MRILLYEELEPKDGLLPLLDHAFRWAFNPWTFPNSIEADPRLRGSGVGFCALENGRVVGFVGMLDLATRTLEGNVEYAGGIYGVASLPGYTRKGVCTTLMNRAHEHFKEKGYRFSLLGTSHTIVAHSLYEKLGYRDLFEAQSAYKVTETTKIEPVEKPASPKLDFERLLRMYDGHVRGKAGFVVRDEDHYRMFEKNEGLSGRNCLFDEDGYVLFSEIKQGSWVNGIWVREMVASDAKAMNRLLGRVEGRAKHLICDRAVLDGSLLEVYRSRGYMIVERSHSVIMVKPLLPEASFTETYSKEIHMTGLDFF